MGVRLFVAVDLGPHVRQGLHRVMDGLREGAPRARWANPEGSHLTLAFLGSTDEALVPSLCDALTAVAAQAHPFELAIAGGGSFGGAKRPRVLWMGVEGNVAALGALHEATEAALAPLGYQPEHRPFRPHLTLARSRDPRGDPALARCAATLQSESLGKTRVSRVVLFRSQPGPGGSRYTALCEPALGG